MDATPDTPTHIKATREDWLEAALEALVAEGEAGVKILALSARLGVSRSSFYWYFDNREALLDALLAAWGAQNTGAFIAQCAAPSATITEGLCNLFRAFVNPALFDPRLDFAVREWARRSAPVRAAVDAADAERLAAIGALFRRHGYSTREAAMRARVLYFMQIGYYALDVAETIEARLALVPEYLEGFTGREAQPGEVEDLAAYARSLSGDRS